MKQHLPQRKSPRLNGYDYTREGAYFVTIVTALRQNLFGHVRDGEVILSALGQIAHNEIKQLPAYWNGGVDTDLFVVMPNHVHMIILLAGPVSGAQQGAQNPGAQNRDTQKPGAQNLDVQKPDVQNPDAQKPNAQNPDAQKRVYVGACG